VVWTSDSHTRHRITRNQNECARVIPGQNAIVGHLVRAHSRRDWRLLCSRGLLRVGERERQERVSHRADDEAGKEGDVATVHLVAERLGRQEVVLS